MQWLPHLDRRASPLMSHADTLENMGVLDVWRGENRVVLGSEERDHARP